MKKCQKDSCAVLVSDPKANYCKVHRGSNPRISKKLEQEFVDYLRRHYPSLLKDK